jgi:hypothetical protein
MFRIPSHAVHGTWPDLLMHHIQAADGGYKPQYDSKVVDARLLDPSAGVALRAALAYLSKFLPSVPERQLLADRTADLLHRLERVDEAHERVIHRRHQGQE